MSNLLLITDVSRLQNIFGLLAVNPAVHLRIATNLEKGSDEIMHDRPDIVFVQTHISGFSADILLKHLKKHARDTLPYFVLLAAPAQLGSTTLQSFQGWLDTTAEDNRFLTDLQSLVASLVATSVVTESSAIFDVKSAVNGTAEIPDDTLEAQGLLYTPRPSLSVYSEFTANFDSAVRESGEPEQLPGDVHFNITADEEIGPADQFTSVTKRTRSTRTSFLLWLIVVVIAGVAFTFYQQSRPQNRITDQKASESDGAKKTSSAQSALSSAHPSPPLPKAAIPTERPAQLPNFIPRTALDTSFGPANPGWERYATPELEYRVFRETGTIKALQMIALAGTSISKPFLQDIQKQLTSNASFVRKSSEKTGGYTIERGDLSENMQVVYYRDEKGVNLKAVVLSWR